MTKYFESKFLRWANARGLNWESFHYKNQTYPYRDGWTFNKLGGAWSTESKHKWTGTTTSWEDRGKWSTSFSTDNIQPLLWVDKNQRLMKKLTCRTHSWLFPCAENRQRVVISRMDLLWPAMKILCQCLNSFRNEFSSLRRTWKRLLLDRVSITLHQDLRASNTMGVSSQDHPW